MDNILVIQDSPSINILLKVRLESGGFSVHICETGEAGLEEAKAGQYKLILLDYGLPGMNGLEVCRILKKEESTKNIPVILTSAMDEGELCKIVKDAGADGYIALEEKGLTEKLKKLMEDVEKTDKRVVRKGGQE